MRRVQFLLLLLALWGGQAQAGMTVEKYLGMCEPVLASGTLSGREGIVCKYYFSGAVEGMLAGGINGAGTLLDVLDSTNSDPQQRQMLTYLRSLFSGQGNKTLAPGFCYQGTTTPEDLMGVFYDFVKRNPKLHNGQFTSVFMLAMQDKFPVEACLN